jgi:hypothetical protein
MRLPSLFLASALVLTTASARADDPPPGLHFEERPRVGMAIAGGIVTATGLAFIGYGLKQNADDRRTLERFKAEDPNYQPDPGTLSGGGLMITMGAIVSAVGVPLLIVGITTKKTVLVRDSVAIAPVVTPSFGGLALSATF